MDLMATPASVHQKWIEGRKTQENIPFYSRYHTPGCAGVDVLTQNVKFMPESSACLLYTSPSPRDGILSRMPSSA